MRTVETHRSHIITKKGSKSRAQLVAYALRAGLLERTPELPGTHRPLTRRNQEEAMSTRIAINGFGRIGRAV